MKKPAHGGVVLDDQARVLLRLPTGGFGDYRWTFPKGRPDGGETPEAAALREVREETGWEAAVLAPIPGDFAGTTTTNSYWLMRAVREVARPDAETETVRWVSVEEAERLIAETPTPTGRARDLAVLRAACEVAHQLGVALRAREVAGS